VTLRTPCVALAASDSCYLAAELLRNGEIACCRYLGEGNLTANTTTLVCRKSFATGAIRSMAWVDDTLALCGDEDGKLHFIRIADKEFEIVKSTSLWSGAITKIIPVKQGVWNPLFAHLSLPAIRQLAYVSTSSGAVFFVGEFSDGHAEIIPTMIAAGMAAVLIGSIGENEATMPPDAKENLVEFVDDIKSEGVIVGGKDLSGLLRINDYMRLKSILSIMKVPDAAHQQELLSDLQKSVAMFYYSTT
jgi:hypothetical protein